MINLTDADKAYFSDFTKSTRFVKRVTIRPADRILYNKLDLADDVLWNNGITIDRSISQNGIDVGSCIYAKATITFIVNEKIEQFLKKEDLYKASVEIFFQSPTDPDVEYKVYTGFVAETPLTKSDVITLVAYDKLWLLDEPLSKAATGPSATRAVTIKEYFKEIFNNKFFDYKNLKDRTILVDNETNSNSPVFYDSIEEDQRIYPYGSAVDPRSFTKRQFLSWLLQARSQYAIVDEDGYINIMDYPFDKMSGQWTAENRIDTVLNPSDYFSLEVGSTPIKIVGASVEVIDLSSNVSIFSTGGGDGVVIAIRENELLREFKASNLSGTQTGGGSTGWDNYKKYGGKYFTPFTLTMHTNLSLNVGDPIVIVDKKGEKITSFITDIKMQPGNLMTVSNNGEMNLRKTHFTGYTSSIITKVDQKIDEKVDKAVGDMESRYEESYNSLQSLVSNSSGMYVTTVYDSVDKSKVDAIYIHENRLLSDSLIQWKVTASSFGVSTDGGNTWNAGLTKDGDLVTRILASKGINADWIQTGKLAVFKKLDNGTKKTALYVDLASGQFKIDARLGGTFSILSDSVEIYNNMISILYPEYANQKEKTYGILRYQHDKISRFVAQKGKTGLSISNYIGIWVKEGNVANYGMMLASDKWIGLKTNSILIPESSCSNHYIAKWKATKTGSVSIWVPYKQVKIPKGKSGKKTLYKKCMRYKKMNINFRLGFYVGTSSVSEYYDVDLEKYKSVSK